MKDQLIVLMHSSHPLSYKKIGIPDLQGEDILIGKCGYEVQIHALFNKYNLTHYENPAKGKVTSTLIDKQEVKELSGIEVIATPGHVSLYVKNSKTLIAGDALICENGKLKGPIPEYTLDMDEALSSAAKLMDYEIETVICYHGGIASGNIKEQLLELTSK